ncbi:hypothetical protein ABZS85_32060, partial [Streptomyces sp. NPDC005322]
LVNRFQFVADHQRRYGVKRLCTILNIARSSFCYWRRTAANRAARQAADARLATRIQRQDRNPGIRDSTNLSTAQCCRGQDCGCRRVTGAEAGQLPHNASPRLGRFCA